MTKKQWIITLVFLGLCWIASWIIPVWCHAETGTYSAKNGDTVVYLKFTPGPFSPGEQGKAKLYTIENDIDEYDYAIDPDRPDNIRIIGVGMFEKSGRNTIEFFSLTGLKMQQVQE